MKNYPSILLFLTCSVSLLLLSACGEDDEPVVPPKVFSVVLEVTTPGGDPVPGLELGLAPDTPYYQDGKTDKDGFPPLMTRMDWPFPSPFNPSVIIPFELATTGQARVSVEDIEGGLVKLLGDQGADSGSHQWIWNGLNDSGEGVPSGIYYARLVLTETGTERVLADDSKSMLLAVFYADQVLVGTTDAEGRLVLEDKRLFPYLYDLAPFPAMDETGSPAGAITLTPKMRFYFTDPGDGTTLRFDGDVEGPTTLQFVWDPSP